MAERNQEYSDESTGSRRASSVTMLPAAETLRSVAMSSLAQQPTKAEERMSVFWRVFGGTLLSIAALVAVTLYQQFNNGLNDLRNDLSRLNEGRGDFIKKDEFNSRMGAAWGGIKEAKDASTTVATLKEHSLLLEQQVKSGEEERKDLMREVRRLTERLAALEGRQSATTTSTSMPRAEAQ